MQDLKIRYLQGNTIRPFSQTKNKGLFDVDTEGGIKWMRTCASHYLSIGADSGIQALQYLSEEIIIVKIESYQL